ncbi:MAG: glycosyl transferase family 2 [Leptolyngbya sp.]|jgi:glycosyltransferase involved in cell wall biosynthesis|uniref:Glycosyl transferase family 2 n=1 Tax=Shackletoniella antarctica TaxID=268115 RepID=A0A2W4VTT0_9CYAN|nr:MAG: glycosyl transferase family 2 [Shackletoniella antarctica]PZV14258.1 MAG: glycosyl transferase family 2 [Leptolyngbya sp.]
MVHGAVDPMVSVVIPVYNDSERLGVCLTALARQTYPKSRYEVIVIDNGSDRADLIQAVAAPYPNVAVAFETTPGSYAARNRGLDLAAGDVIAFTDADCIPADNWLQQGIEQLQGLAQGGQVVGKVEVFFANPERPTPVDLYESITAFPQERLLQKLHGGATANMLAGRHVFDRVGLFNAQLRSHGDLEWGQRVYSQGFQQVYAESVVVWHPTRSSLRALIRRTQRLAGGSYALHTQQSKTIWQRHMVFLRALAQNLVPPIFFALRALFDGRLKGGRQKLQVSLVMVLVRYVSAFEILRLKLGGTPCRD